MIAAVLFFFKELGGVQKSKTGRTLEGRTWDESRSLLLSKEFLIVVARDDDTICSGPLASDGLQTSGSPV